MSKPQTKSYGKVKIVQDAREQFDRIIVRGAKIKSVGTFRVENGDLVIGWTEEEETAYKAAASSASGYGSLTDEEKADLNDKYRSVDRFERVYTTFVVPDSWTWELDGEIVTPQYITECPRKTECKVGPNPSDSDWEKCPLPKAIRKYIH